MVRRSLNNSTKSLALFLIALTVLAGSSYATNGYFSLGYGTKYLGLAGAGVALSLNALGVATNPASLAFLGNRTDISLALFNPNREYTISGNPSGYPGTFGLTPGTIQSDSRAFLMPSIGASWQLNDTLSLGFALYGNGGMNSNYPTNTFYGTSPTGVNLMQIFIAPTVAVKIAQKHGIGLTPIFCYQAFKAEGLQAFSSFSSDAAHLTNTGSAGSTGFGVRVGYLGELSPYLSLGASYQTKLNMTPFKKYAGLFAEQGDFDIPANWTAGLAIKPTKALSIALDVQEILYSGVKSIHSPFNPADFYKGIFLGSDGGPGFGWKNMTIFKGGIQWQSNEKWAWRAGYSSGKQPIPESEVLFNILAPGVVDQHLTFGCTFGLGGKKEISIAVMRAFAKNVSGPNPMEVPGLQTIELKMDQWQFEVGFSF
jgi:long-chain fatty acid transport protein